MNLNQSVQKAAAILRAAAARPDGETASGLARMAGLSHATSLRLVHTLENEGLLMRRPEDGRYVIGLDLVRLGAAGEHAELLSVVSRKPLKRVAEETRETVTLSVLRGREALDVVLQIDAPHVIRRSIGSGSATRCTQARAARSFSPRSTRRDLGTSSRGRSSDERRRRSPIRASFSASSSASAGRATP